MHNTSRMKLDRKGESEFIGVIYSQCRMQKQWKIRTEWTKTARVWLRQQNHFVEVWILSSIKCKRFVPFENIYRKFFEEMLFLWKLAISLPKCQRVSVTSVQQVWPSKRWLARNLFFNVNTQCGPQMRTRVEDVKGGKKDRKSDNKNN